MTFEPKKVDFISQKSHSQVSIKIFRKRVLEDSLSEDSVSNMIVYKVFIILDDDEAKVITVSDESLDTFLRGLIDLYSSDKVDEYHPKDGISGFISFEKSRIMNKEAMEAISSAGSSSGVNVYSYDAPDGLIELIRKILDENSLHGIDISHSSGINSIVVEERDVLDRNLERVDKPESDSSDNPCDHVRTDADHTKTENEKAELKKQQDSDRSDNICKVLNICSKIPYIITSNVFKTLIQTNPLKRKESTNENTSKSVQLSSIDLLLQPLDFSLLYVPRAGRQCVDMKLRSGQSLLWRFRVENDFDINFGMFVYICEPQDQDNALVNGSYTQVSPFHGFGSAITNYYSILACRINIQL